VTVAALVLLAATRSGDAESGKPRLQLPRDPKPGQVFVNPVDGMELVFIPGGEFMMGDDDSEFRLDKPAHKVKVVGFWLGKYEVTNEQYSKFVETTGHREPLRWDDDAVTVTTATAYREPSSRECARRVVASAASGTNGLVAAQQALGCPRHGRLSRCLRTRSIRPSGGWCTMGARGAREVRA